MFVLFPLFIHKEGIKGSLGCTSELPPTPLYTKEGGKTSQATSDLADIFE
jgi:hypothetical protein